MDAKAVRLSAAAGMVLATIIWGTGFVFVKSSLAFVPPIYMIAIRFTIASVAMLLVFCKQLKHITRETVLHGGILGIFLFAGYAFQTVGCVYTTAGNNALLTCIYVVFVPLIVWGLYRRRPGLPVFAAAFIAIAGIALLSLQPSPSGEPLGSPRGFFFINVGDILTLICGFWYAVHIVFIERYTRRENPLSLTIVQIVWTAAFSWVLAPLYDGAFPTTIFHSAGVIGSMLYLGIACTTITFLLQNTCQKYLTSSAAALLLSLESMFGVIAAVIFLDEVLTRRMILGCVLLFSAIMISEKNK